MKAKLINFLFFSDLHGIRFLLGFAEILWGITLLLPGDTFGRPTYSVMRSFATEELWAVVFISMGILQWSILASRQYHSRIAIVFSAVNAIFWCFITCAMYISVTPIPSAISGETALGVGASWVFIRTGIRRHADD